MIRTCQTDNHIFFHSLTNHPDVLAWKPCKGPGDEMTIIPPQVMEEDGNFTSPTKAQVAFGMGCPSILPCNMVVIPNLVFSFGVEWFVANVAMYFHPVKNLFEGCDCHPFLIHIELNRPLRQCHEFIQQPINAILSEVGLIGPLELWKNTNHLESHRARGLCLIVKCFAPRDLGDGFDESLKISINYQRCSYSVSRVRCTKTLA